MHCRRVSKAGKTYRCAEALAQAFGVSRSAVYQSLHRHGHAEVVGKPKGITPGSGKANHCKPVRVGPHQWPSVVAMAKDLGVNRRSIGEKLLRDPEGAIALVMRKMK